MVIASPPPRGVSRYRFYFRENVHDDAVSLPEALSNEVYIGEMHHRRLRILAFIGTVQCCYRIIYMQYRDGDELSEGAAVIESNFSFETLIVGRSMKIEPMTRAHHTPRVYVYVDV